MTEAWLVHFMADRGEGEYFALVEKDGDEIKEYQEEGYGISGVFELVPVSSGDDTSSLPLNRTFKEW